MIGQPFTLYKTAPYVELQEVVNVTDRASIVIWVILDMVVVLENVQASGGIQTHGDVGSLGLKHG